MAFVLIRRNGALLIDEAAPADVQQRLRQAVGAVEITPVGPSG